MEQDEITPEDPIEVDPTLADRSPTTGPFAYSDLGVTNEDDPTLGFGQEDTDSYLTGNDDDRPDPRP